MKRIFSLLTMCLIFLSLLSISAYANEATVLEGECGKAGEESLVKWSLDKNSGELLISGSGRMRDWSKNAVAGDNAAPWKKYSDIITSVKITGIKEIGDCSFSNMLQISSVSINDSITEIPQECFAGCIKLENTELPDTIAVIKSGAFFGCSSLNAVKLPEKLEQIGDLAFSACTKLINIKIPDFVSSIGEASFYGCLQLKDLSFGIKVAEIGKGAFYSCSNIEKISVSPKNEHYYSDNSCLIEKQSKKLILGCCNSVLPNDINEIGDGAFINCNKLTDITLPEGVLKIGNHAFEKCTSLQSITLPNSLSQIGEFAFADCTSLKTVNLRSEIKYGDSAFKNCISLNSEGMQVFERSNTDSGCYLFSSIAFLAIISISSLTSIVLMKNH